MNVPLTLTEFITAKRIVFGFRGRDNLTQTTRKRTLLNEMSADFSHSGQIPLRILLFFELWRFSFTIRLSGSQNQNWNVVRIIRRRSQQVIKKFWNGKFYIFPNFFLFRVSVITTGITGKIVLEVLNMFPSLRDHYRSYHHNSSNSWNCKTHNFPPLPDRSNP